MLLVKKLNSGNDCEKGTPGYTFILDTLGVGGNYWQTWMDGIFPYVKNISMFTCPSLKKKMNAGTSPKENVATYGANINIFDVNKYDTAKAQLQGGTIVPSVCLSQVKTTSDFIFCLDGTITTGTYNYWIPYMGAVLMNYFNTDTTGRKVLRHNEGANFTFADGHAKYFKRAVGNPAYTASGGWGDQSDCCKYWMPQGDGK